MATGCSVITKGIGVNCAALPNSGTQDRLILINKDDIASYTPHSYVPKSYTAIVFKTGKVGYAFDGQFNSNKAKNTLLRTTYSIKYTHTIDFVAFDVSPDAMNTLETLNLARLVAVYLDNNGYYRIMGKNNGLIVQTNEGDTSNQDTGGGHLLQLFSGEEKKFADYLAAYTGTSPNFVYDPVGSATAFANLLVVGT